jgi:flavin-dependent dehydrogenase
MCLQNEDKDHYDVAIVGAGPAGSTCAYFLGKHI